MREIPSKRLGQAAALTLAGAMLPTAAIAESGQQNQVEEDYQNPVPNELFVDQAPASNKVVFEDPLTISLPPTNSVESVEIPDEQVEEELKKGIYKKNLYSNKGKVMQFNNRNCVMAATQMMLNFTYINGTMPEGSDWKLNTSNKMQRQLGNWIRAHDTLYSGGVGSDFNGWRNGLNKFSGAGNFKNPDKMLYEVKTFSNKRKAMREIVESIAMYDMPVGVSGWNGQHAFVAHGFRSTGYNPAESEEYRVDSISITSPWRPDNIVNKKISAKQFLNGRYHERLTFYNENDSFDDDPYTPGKKQAYKDWKNKVVLVVPTGYATQE